MPVNSLAITATGQTAVIMDCKLMSCNKDDATLFQIIDEVQFYEYPHCSGVGYSDFSLMPGVTVVMKAQFHVKQGTALEPVALQNLTVGIFAVKKTAGVDFPLESYTLNTAGYLPNCDHVQEIDYTETRDFIFPKGD